MKDEQSQIKSLNQERMIALLNILKEQGQNESIAEIFYIKASGKEEGVLK